MAMSGKYHRSDAVVTSCLLRLRLPRPSESPREPLRRERDDDAEQVTPLTGAEVRSCRAILPRYGEVYLGARRGSIPRP